jgi:putative addiction module component (TIGR02574 family)
MTYYGVKHLAGAFRTVRQNTIAIAQDIPEDKYTFRAAPNTRTVSQPAEERARLALELIRSLDTEAEGDAADAWDAEIARRGAEVDAGIAATMTADEYRAHVRQRRAARARR